MKTIIRLSAAVLIAACAIYGGIQASASAPEKAAKDQAALNEALKGMVAGPPRDCIQEYYLEDNKSFGRNVILFKGRTPGVVYVNNLPGAGCPEVDTSRALRTKSPMPQLCRGDIVTVFDPNSRIDIGSCSLGEFTPYHRAP